MIYSETPRRKKVTKLVTWGHWFALLNMLIAIVLAGIYIFSSPLPGSALGTFYLFTNWFSHIGFLIFFGFVIFILPLCYVLPREKTVKAIAATIAASGIALLAFDALLYNRYGLHISIGSAELIRNEAETVVAQFGWQQWGFFILLFIVWLSLQLIIANALWQRLERLQKYRLGLPISSFFVACFTASHAMHIWADARLYQPIMQQDDMFPLSYPATAKTLMSRYGLLDKDSYQQRKQLQFGSKINQINYPSEPVYCGVEFTSQTLFVIATESIQDIQIEGLSNVQNHYSFAADEKSKVLASLFGLPELYHSVLVSYKPLLLDIPARIGLHTFLYWNDKSLPPPLAGYQQEWQDLPGALAQQQGKLIVLVVNKQQLTELLNTPNWLQQNTVITSTVVDESNQMTLLTNLPILPQLSSQEDLAPTLLNSMGCQANSNSYSTGRNLMENNRNWVISTDQSRVFVLHNGHRIEINSNGNYKILQRQTLEPITEELNTGLLSQAMKHLSRFN